MTKKNCYSFNEIFVVATIIIILRNIYKFRFEVIS